MTPTLKIAAGATAMVLVAAVGLSILAPARGVGRPTPSPSPSATPVASTAIAAMDTPFMSPRYGYSLRHPADWTANPADRIFDPAKASNNTSGVFLDAIGPPDGNGLLRAGSAAIPAGSDGEAWTGLTITGCDVPCREAREAIVIDGQPAFVNIATDGEVEATVIVGDRVYFFTLFRGSETNGLPNLRSTFDALMATVDLRPQDAQPLPAPSPSPSANPGPS